MIHTYEVRWFFPDCPLEVSSHFGDESELQSRTDWYAFPCSADCGIKLREGKLETKIRCQAGAPQQAGGFAGQLESFKKWSLLFPADDKPTVDDLGLAGWIEVKKQRRLRRFCVTEAGVDHSPVRPENGCEFELTQLTVNSGIYWTVGFEAVGSIDRLESNLRTVMEFVDRAGGRRQSFSLGHSMGYAEWLSQFNADEEQ